MKPMATFTLVVEYEEIPDSSEIESLVDTARSVGHVTCADLVVKRDAKRSFI